jgi:hypothetical protein
MVTQSCANDDIGAEPQRAPLLSSANGNYVLTEGLAYLGLIACICPGHLAQIRHLKHGVSPRAGIEAPGEAGIDFRSRTHCYDISQCIQRKALAHFELILGQISEGCIRRTNYEHGHKRKPKDNEIPAAKVARGGTLLKKIDTFSWLVRWKA